MTEDAFDLKTLFLLGDVMPGGFFIYRADEGQELLYANRATRQIFGCETEEQFRDLTGYTFRGLVHPEDYEQTQSAIEQQIAGTDGEKLDFVKYRIIRRDGEIRWLSDFGRLVEAPEIGKVYFVFITDATERQRAREEKQRVEMELARERERNEVKSALLFNMSHDLRTPLNAVIGFTELAKRRIDEPARAAGYLDKTLSAARQLGGFLDDLLEMNNIGAAALRPESCDLREQLGLALDLFRFGAAEKGITLREEYALGEERVLVDARSLRRVLSNLLSNAVKFTPAGGFVTLSAKRGAVSDSGYARFELCVRDTGAGIDAAFLEKRMFQAFEREGSSTQTGKSGTGLGLSIVKSLLDQMGGTIRVESRKGEGSAFTVELPLRLAQAAEEKPTITADAGREDKARVLVVEDIEINRLLVEGLLEEEGFLVETVPDGCDAVEAVETHPPGYYDLILMDIQMPVMNGYEATRSIRSLPRPDCARLPILALSANSRDEDRQKSRESGMNGHMAKPFDIDELTEAIRQLVDESRKSE